MEPEGVNFRKKKKGRQFPDDEGYLTLESVAKRGWEIFPEAF